MFREDLILCNLCNKGFQVHVDLLSMLEVSDSMLLELTVEGVKNIEGEHVHCDEVPQCRVQLGSFALQEVRQLSSKLHPCRATAHNHESQCILDPLPLLRAHGQIAVQGMDVRGLLELLQHMVL